MKNVTKRANFLNFSGIIWHELGNEKAIHFIQDFEEKINISLENKSYGQGLHKIYFSFLIHIPQQIIHKNYRRFDKSKQILTIQRTVNYENALQANQTEYLQLLAQTFLAATKEMKKWKILDFDAENFAIDVENALVDFRNDVVCADQSNGN